MKYVRIPNSTVYKRSNDDQHSHSVGKACLQLVAGRDCVSVSMPPPLTSRPLTRGNLAAPARLLYRQTLDQQAIRAPVASRTVNHGKRACPPWPGFTRRANYDRLMTSLSCPLSSFGLFHLGIRSIGISRTSLHFHFLFPFITQTLTLSPQNLCAGQAAQFNTGSETSRNEQKYLRCYFSGACSIPADSIEPHIVIEQSSRNEKKTLCG